MLICSYNNIERGVLMENIQFEDNQLIITNRLRKIILDLITENDYSDSTNDSINLFSNEDYSK